MARADALTYPLPRCATAKRPHILVVDGDLNTTQMLELELVYAGYEVTVVRDGIAGLISARTAAPALMVLGWTLPDLSGLEICRRLRLTGNSLPILVITDAPSPDDASAKRIASLKAGANDAVSLPLNLEELTLRIQMQIGFLQRRCELLQFADVVLDRSARQVFRNHALVELTTKEFDLLDYLMMHPRQVLTRSQILETIWGYDFMGNSNIIEVYVRYLRVKLEAPSPIRLIHTVRGVGYVLRS